MSKKKGCIVQIFVSTDNYENKKHLDWQNDECIKLSTMMCHAYAEKHGLDYFFIQEGVVNYKHPTWERFMLLDDKWVKEYEYVIYLDTDVFPWAETDDITKQFEKDKLNIVRHIECNPGAMPKDPEFHINAGVICFTEGVAQQIRELATPEEWDKRFVDNPLYHDNHFMNELTAKVPTHVLPSKWNHKRDINAHITHLWGKRKTTENAAFKKARKQLGIK